MIQEYYVRGRGGDGRLPAGQWAFVCLWHRALYWMMMILTKVPASTATYRRGGGGLEGGRKTPIGVCGARELPSQRKQMHERHGALPRLGCGCTQRSPWVRVRGAAAELLVLWRAARQPNDYEGRGWLAGGLAVRRVLASGGGGGGGGWG